MPIHASPWLHAWFPEPNCTSTKLRSLSPFFQPLATSLPPRWCVITAPKIYFYFLTRNLHHPPASALTQPYILDSVDMGTDCGAISSYQRALRRSLCLRLESLTHREKSMRQILLPASQLSPGQPVRKSAPPNTKVALCVNEQPCYFKICKEHPVHQTT